jgi:hypothetical protein
MASKCQWADCECKRTPIPKERFCAQHRAAMLRRMKDSGYLQPLPKDSVRSSDDDALLPDADELDE